MDAPDPDTVQQQTNAIIAAIYETGATEDGSVVLDFHATMYALQMAAFHFMQNLVVVAEREIDIEPEPESEPMHVRRRRRHITEITEEQSDEI